MSGVVDLPKVVFQSTPTPRGVGDGKGGARLQSQSRVSIHSYPAWGRRQDTSYVVSRFADVSIHSYPAWGRRRNEEKGESTQSWRFNPLLPRVG